jgi:hypothetical protein
MRLQVSLRDAFWLFIVLGLLLAWLIDRRALNNEAASLFGELYKHRSRMQHELQNYRYQPPAYSSLAPAMQAQYQGVGVTLDSRTRSGRHDALQRLKKGDLDFLITDGSGDIVKTVQGTGFDQNLVDVDDR